jgi:hypothetical protein
MKHIFLSYSHKDREYMQQVYANLTQIRNLSVWTDDELKLGSSDWQSDVEEKIATSTCMVVLLSPDANESKWVRAEITFAKEHDIEIFPALLRGDEKDIVPLSLRTYQRFPLYPNFLDGMGQLVAAIQSRRMMESEGQPASDELYSSEHHFEMRLVEYSYYTLKPRIGDNEL